MNRQSQRETTAKTSARRPPTYRHITGKRYTTTEKSERKPPRTNDDVAAIAKVKKTLGFHEENVRWTAKPTRRHRQPTIILPASNRHTTPNQTEKRLKSV